MIPATHVASMIGMNRSAEYQSSAALSLGQEPPFQYQHQHQLVEIPQTTVAEIEMPTVRDDEFETKSFGDNIENASEDDRDGNQRPRKKQYHRHTQHQIQELEAFFKECPHPDDKQRKELSRELGLEPLQVKFWFQNKRTQTKNHQERHENSRLRAENEKLRAENLRYKEALSNASCPNCGGPSSLGEMSFDEHQLRIDNSRLREEIGRLSAIAAKYVGKPVVPHQLFSPMAESDMLGAGDLLGSMFGHREIEKPAVIELAVVAMEELTRMARLSEPLWTMKHGDSFEILSEDEYVRNFPRGIGPKPLGMKSEATRQTAAVIMNRVNLVEMLMDVNQWSNVFSGIVSKAITLEVLSTGVAGNYDGALQLMTAEFQVPSPLVPTREILFVRYCKHQADGSWAVVDVSLDTLRPPLVARCRRRPSGCLIQEMPNGYSKVTWVEHAEVDDGSVHDIYKPLVNSGLAFGATRWIGSLDRQCERLASLMASNVPSGDITVITTAEGRKCMLRLAERMVTSFCGGVSASTAHQWTTVSGNGAEDVRVMTRKSVGDPGRPPGIVLNAAKSFWLPVPQKRVFDFLRDERSRNEWDILSNGGGVQEMAHIANGRDHGNCVSLLRVNSVKSSQSNMLILQESCTDPVVSYVIYAPVDVVAMNVVLNGGDPDYVALLPSGFAILPDGASAAQGSLVTVAFEILVDSVPTAKISLGSVATVNSLIACTVERIKAALVGENVA
ncbi:homeobox-leucine zipper protein ROC2-like [Musa acuminata AAA Group]|uniref:homeobox-leucine zipper protein ROC2-like n=1 Tax=Musa acuminata AAA Group TaxID=214697 RepID=UPI0031D7AE1B